MNSVRKMSAGAEPNMRHVSRARVGRKLQTDGKVRGNPQTDMNLRQEDI